MKKGSKAQSPGPGQYIDMANPMFIANTGMSKYHSERGIGGKPQTANTVHFGSKSLRFERGAFNAKDGPGPGEYSHERDPSQNELTGILTKAQIEGKGKGGAVFRSTTNRFVENHPDNPQIRILDKKPQYRNDLMIYNIKQRHDMSRTNYNNGAPRYTKHVGFTATSPRFAHNQLFYGHKLKYTPGPGDYAYDANARPKSFGQGRPKNTKQLGIFNSSEMKFCKGNNSYLGLNGTSTNIGPGSYDVNGLGDMIKKTFNHSM